jgi:hypothetical protein
MDLPYHELCADGALSLTGHALSGIFTLDQWTSRNSAETGRASQRAGAAAGLQGPPDLWTNDNSRVMLKFRLTNQP